jgi:hypothetical protein
MHHEDAPNWEWTMLGLGARQVSGQVPGADHLTGANGAGHAISAISQALPVKIVANLEEKVRAAQ